MVSFTVLSQNNGAKIREFFPYWTPNPRFLWMLRIPLFEKKFPKKYIFLLDFRPIFIKTAKFETKLFKIAL